MNLRLLKVLSNSVNRQNRFTFLGNGLLPSDADDEADR